MSMISSLIDELNKSADEWNGSNMFELARMCREAVDTITELHGALQVASVDYRHIQADNVKLRDENARLRSCLSDDAENARMIMGENAKLREEVVDLRKSLQTYESENAKLRELVRHTVECVRRLNDTSENGGCVLCPYQLIDYDCDFEKRTRELGIEVDE